MKEWQGLSYGVLRDLLWEVVKDLERDYDVVHLAWGTVPLFSTETPGAVIYYVDLDEDENPYIAMQTPQDGGTLVRTFHVPPVLGVKGGVKDVRKAVEAMARDLEFTACLLESPGRLAVTVRLLYSGWFSIGMFRVEEAA